MWLTNSLRDSLITLLWDGKYTVDNAPSSIFLGCAFVVIVLATLVGTLVENVEDVLAYKVCSYYAVSASCGLRSHAVCWPCREPSSAAASCTSSRPSCCTSSGPDSFTLVPPIDHHSLPPRHAHALTTVNS
jgi:hypothetical protein